MIGAALPVGGMIAAVAAVAGIEAAADRKAERILETVRHDDPEATVEALGRYAAKHFREESGGLYGWLPLFYHRRLPEPVRMRHGTLDILVFRGQCSDMARALGFVLRRDGFEVVQHDIVAPSSGHSALSIRMPDGRWVYADPFFGVVFRQDDRILSLAEVQDLVETGVPITELANPLVEEARLAFYDEIGEAYHARLGEPLDVTIALPLDEPLVLGELDGSYEDVDAEAMALGLTSHLFYLGPRFDDDFSFRFVPEGSTDRPWRIAFDLTEPVDPDVLPKSNVEPEIDGNRLIYEIRAPEDGLLLRYAGMGRHWYGIDRLEAAYIGQP